MPKSLMPTSLPRCYFCRQPWGHCRCAWDESDGFETETEDFYITEPNVSECGRFFVDPYAHYGAAFASWFTESYDDGLRRRTNETH